MDLIDLSPHARTPIRLTVSAQTTLRRRRRQAPLPSLDGSAAWPAQRRRTKSDSVSRRSAVTLGQKTGFHATTRCKRLTLTLSRLGTPRWDASAPL